MGLIPSMDTVCHAKPKGAAAVHLQMFATPVEQALCWSMQGILPRLALHALMIAMDVIFWAQDVAIQCDAILALV